jgi:hypothetical protein
LPDGRYSLRFTDPDGVYSTGYLGDVSQGPWEVAIQVIHGVSQPADIQLVR